VKKNREKKDRTFDQFETRAMAEDFNALCVVPPDNEAGAGFYRLKTRALISIAASLDSIAFSLRETLKDKQEDTARQRRLFALAEKYLPMFDKLAAEATRPLPPFPGVRTARKL
jgi:hypothetical protein